MMDAATVDGAHQAVPPSRWAAPLGAGLAFAGLLVLGLTISLWFGHSPGWAYDFYAYYDAALRLIATGSPYQAETLSAPFRPGPFGLYLYSPPLALLFVPLTYVGENAATVIWLVLRLAVLVLTCALMPVPRPIRLAMFGIAALSAPVLFDLDLGNVSLIVTFLGVLAWRWLDKPAGSIALAISLTVRPTMGLICGWWLLRGVWRPVLWTVMTFAVLVAVTLPFVGVERWFEYVTVLRNVSNVTGVRSNVDLGSAVLLFGGPAALAPMALFAGYALAIGAMLVSLRRDRELSYVVTVMATLLLAPLLWDHYLTNLLIPAAFLASRGRTWGLFLPLLCWLPTLLVGLNGDFRGAAEGLLPFIALAGMLLPFAAPDRGQPAGIFLDRLTARLSTRPARA
jgi:hypothetical protein